MIGGYQTPHLFFDFSPPEHPHPTHGFLFPSTSYPKYKENNYISFYTPALEEARTYKMALVSC